MVSIGQKENNEVKISYQSKFCIILAVFRNVERVYEACYELFPNDISVSLRLLATQLFSQKGRSGGEPLATALRPI